MLAVVATAVVIRVTILYVGVGQVLAAAAVIVTVLYVGIGNYCCRPLLTPFPGPETVVNERGGLAPTSGRVIESERGGPGVQMEGILLLL